jgi:hypothetical protein
MEATTEFEHLGFSKDYILNGRYIGCVKLKKADREVMGYHGRKQELLPEDIDFGNRKLKAGTEVITELYPLCGEVIDNPFKKVEK